MHPVHLVVDAANVVGSRPDGWWRDRAGAAARLVEALAAGLRSGTLDPPITVVLEGAARAGVPAGPYPVAAEQTGWCEPDEVGQATGPEAAGLLLGRATALTMVHAERDGDSAIVALVGSPAAEVCVVTADRGLRARVVAEGAAVVGPSWLLDRL